MEYNWKTFGLARWAEDYPLKYHKKNAWFNASMAPGTGAYAMSPQGAKKMIKAAAEGSEEDAKEAEQAKAASEKEGAEALAATEALAAAEAEAEAPAGRDTAKIIYFQAV